MFWENFYKLCEKNNEKPLHVVKNIGISVGSITKWKNGSVPSGASLSKLAEYFNVTVDELLSDGEPTESKAAPSLFYSNFMYLCEHEKTPPEKVAAALDLQPSVINSWKNGSVPKWGVLYNVAGYFNVPLADLIGTDMRAEKPRKLAEERNTPKVHMIPLYEDVSAGFGALAVDHVVEYVPLYFSTVYEAQESLCIKVRGDSMSPKIEDGDVILVHKQDSVESGSIAVVLVDGDNGLVKKVVYSDNWIELQSLNPLYIPMRFNGKDKTAVRIVGAVKKIIKEI